MRLFNRHNSHGGHGLHHHHHRGRGHQRRESSRAVHQQMPAHNFHAQVATLIPAEVRMISGCHSEQTSADVSNVATVGCLPNPAGKAGGACTSALLEILYQKSNSGISFQRVLLELRESLAKKGFEQIPQLTSSRPLDLEETAFSLVGGCGERRALLVGCNYVGQYGQLRGCHNDIYNVKEYIKTQGYEEHNILVLADDGQHHYPNRANIIKALQQLVAQSVDGDSVYFHYSGHGGLLEPMGNLWKASNKEYDETLYPLDHLRAGLIRDFSLFNHFVKPMPAGVTVTCVLDCCHSGSVLDLPYSYQPTPAGTIRMRNSIHDLSNLAFLYILAGGMLPMGFEDVALAIEDATGETLDNLQGLGMPEENGALDDANYVVDDTDGGADNICESREYDENTGVDYYDPNDDIGYGDDALGMSSGDDGGAGGAAAAGSFGAAINDITCADADADTGDAGDGVDCSCLADVLQNLLDADD